MKTKTYAVLTAALTIITLFPQCVHAEEGKSLKGIHKAYISGYPDGSMRPEEYITREEAASVFYRLLPKERQKKAMPFSDVPDGSWSFEAIATLAGEGIISGGDGLFRPKERITRAEMAVMAAKFEGLKGGGKTFSDINGHWAEEYISAAVSNGWLAGYTNGEFKPDNSITRAETMLLINNVLGRRPEGTNDLLEDMTTWTDNSDISNWYYLAVQEASNSHEYTRRDNGFEKWLAITKD
ncbi:cell surface glycoprotein 2 [Clostridiales bacterium]|nr:cell surface glycoprotein 2 [Clostridiales bacterium]